ncbi:MAG: serine/threonine-protein kinase [Pseudonocardia sp.]
MTRTGTGGQAGRRVEAGDRLVDRYRLVDMLGAGDMGVVWLAADELLGRTVAVKRVGPDAHEPAGTERARRQILREGRIAAMLDHPRLLRILDVVTDAGEPWLVLEHVEAARSWASLLQQYGPIPPAEAARIAAQVADALVALHGAGVVHGDVTAENILVDADGNVRLADFGVSRLLSDSPETGSSAMTGFRAVRAPEVAIGVAPGTAADIFALGAVVYEAVIGVPVVGSGEDDSGRRFPVPPPLRAGALARVLAELARVEPARRPDAETARSMFADLVEANRIRP